jgi:hypothetical protein
MMGEEDDGLNWKDYFKMDELEAVIEWANDDDRKAAPLLVSEDENGSDASESDSNPSEDNYSDTELFKIYG